MTSQKPTYGPSGSACLNFRVARYTDKYLVISRHPVVSPSRPKPFCAYARKRNVSSNSFSSAG